MLVSGVPTVAGRVPGEWAIFTSPCLAEGGPWLPTKVPMTHFNRDVTMTSQVEEVKGGEHLPPRALPTRDHSPRAPPPPRDRTLL